MAAPAITTTKNISSYTTVYTIDQSGANQGAVVISPVGPVASLSIQGIGATFDSSSIALTVSNDGTTYIAPVTAFTALTAAGVRALPADGLGWLFYKLTWSAAGANAVTQLVVVVKQR